MILEPTILDVKAGQTREFEAAFAKPRALLARHRDTSRANSFHRRRSS